MNYRSAIRSEGPEHLRAAKAGNADIPAAQAASALGLAADAVLIIFLSVTTGTFFHLVSRDIVGDVSAFTATGIIIAVLFCGLVRLQATRDPRGSSTWLGRARMAGTAWAATFVFLIMLAFSLKISAQFSRGYIFLFFALGLCGTIVSRATVPRLLARWTTVNARRGLEVLIVASPGASGAEALRAELAGQGCASIRTIYFDDSCSAVAWLSERKRLLREVFDIARSLGQGEIYVLGGALPFEGTMGLLSGLRLLPRAVYFVPDMQVSSLLLHAVRGVGSVMALEMQKAPLSRIERGIKRLTDIVITIIAVLFASPLLLAIAVWVKLDSSGPLFFRQTRLGYRGRPFQILKFRTMTVHEDGETVRQASLNDQRVTRAGKWLRRSSLDELPQLWNVFLGEMSIVGPRPHAAAHDAHFAKLIDNYEVRQHVKPGMTGWAQVQGLRGETPVLDLMYRRIEADLWYASNCSLALDVQILFKTVGAVLGQRNAF